MKTARGKQWDYYCRKCGATDVGEYAKVSEFSTQHQSECPGRFPNDPGPLKPSGRRLDVWPQMLSRK